MRFTTRLVTRDTKVLPDKVFPEPLRGRRYIPGELYAEAEALRKAGHFVAAEKKYWASIKAGERSADWRQYGPAPAMYEALAKLYYHMRRDQEALGVLDRYLRLQEALGKDDIEMRMLRERMASGKFRRMKLDS